MPQLQQRRRPRDQTVATKFTVEELAEVQRMADNERMSLSEYVRGATLSYMALRGNRVAWRLVGEGLLSVLHEAAGWFREHHVRRVAG